MSVDERLMFHITQGALRRWSLWNEPIFPQWANPAEFTKWQVFQDWKKNPGSVQGTDPTGQPIYQFHPLSSFENWSLWLVLDLLRTISAPGEIYTQFSEPESLKEGITDWCEQLYSDNEMQTATQLVR